MFGTQHLPLFVASGLLLNLMPGPDTLYIVGRSISQGRRAGVVSVLGISSGCAVHTAAAAFGLSAILAASASAGTVRIIGFGVAPSAFSPQPSSATGLSGAGTASQRPLGRWLR